MMKQRLTLFAAILMAPMAIMQLAAAPSPSPAPPFEIILVEGEMVTSAAMSQWKKEGFQAVAVLLDERMSEAAYREVFEGHLARIEQLLKRAPPGWRGLLLNDLQGGPSSCGCGNIQCRWAVDYHVRPTATKLAGENVAAKFIAEVRKRAGDKAVIPVWTTECEEVDLPADKHQGRPGTGLCGTVGCATGACGKEFSNQWSE